MAKYAATIEQAGDGSWTAAFLDGENSVVGSGATRDEALEDLRSGLTGLIEYLKANGRPLPTPSAEIVTIELAV